MQWETDLTHDIRTTPENDNTDRWAAAFEAGPYRSEYPWVEMSECNRNSIKERFLTVRDHAKAILEIGVVQHNINASSYIVFKENKKLETIYIGIDVLDKSHLNDAANNIHTVKGSSSDLEDNMVKIRALGVTEFDFIFIDGEHSLNQVYRDWEYTRFLAPGGIVGFHDVSTHPGPTEFIKAIDKNKWHVIENTCPRDFGTGFVWRK